MSEQLWCSHSHRHNENICNCTMCPMLGKMVSSNYCDLVCGIVSEPKMSWCKPGILFIWMATHSVSDVVDLLGAISN